MSEKEKTVIEDVVAEEPEGKQKRGRKKAKQKVDISFEELQVKLVKVFNFFASAVKSEKRYTEKDFLEESKDLARWGQKHEIIGYIISLLDPLFFIMGLVNKFYEVMSRREKKGEKKVEK